MIIGIMGSGGGKLSEKQKHLAADLGKLIAKSDHTLLTGAGLGLPYIAAKASYDAGGKTIGISPAKNLKEHLKIGFKSDAFSKIEYTGLGFIGRNAINIAKSDTLIFIGGEHGTLNEFTIAYQEGKIIGVLESSGGVSGILKSIIKVFTRKRTSKIFFSRSPRKLLDKILK